MDHDYPIPLEGDPSPWGPIQHSRRLAEGIVEVGTAGHGGIWLSPFRLADMPEEWRSLDGWYEEDCEAVFPLKHFVDDIKYRTPERTRRLAELVDQAVERLNGDFDKIACHRHPETFEDKSRVGAAEAIARSKSQEDDAATGMAPA